MRKLKKLQFIFKRELGLGISMWTEIIVRWKYVYLSFLGAARCAMNLMTVGDDL